MSVARDSRRIKTLSTIDHFQAQPCGFFFEAHSLPSPLRVTVTIGQGFLHNTVKGDLDRQWHLVGQITQRQRDGTVGLALIIAHSVLDGFGSRQGADFGQPQPGRDGSQFAQR